MAFTLPAPLSETERAERLYDWIQPYLPPPTIDIPIVVNLQVHFRAHGSTDLSPPMLVDALDCVDFGRLRAKVQAGDYYMKDHLGNPKAYRLTIKFKDYKYSSVAVLDGTIATLRTAYTVYEKFLQECWECGSILRAELQVEALRKREWVRGNNKGKVDEEEPWEGRGKVYIAYVWAEVKVLFSEPGN